MAKNRASGWAITKIVLAVLAVVLLGGGYLVYDYFLGPYFKRNAIEAAYEGKLPGLFDQAKHIVDAATDIPKDAHRGGKSVWVRAVMMIRRSRNEWDLRIDERMPLLPSDLRADDPGDAAVVVLAYPRSAQVGYYQTKGSGMSFEAYAKSLELFIVDLSKKKVLGHGFFASQPKEQIQLGADSPIAELDDRAVAAWFAELPE
ncbi:MAG: hypothetical protein KIS92_22235 [Planctomycetota bacterium]|nr:hypothetical protein [Planctomycetota bacterium]